MSEDIKAMIEPLAAISRETSREGLSMSVFQIDVPIWATAYIRAENAEEAREKLDAWIKSDGWFDNIKDAISEDRFDDPDLNEISLSPAMTINAPETGEMPMLADGTD